MKKNLLIILIIIFSSCAIKVQEGQYCQQSAEGGGSCITFKKGFKFEWKTNYDFGPPSAGKGLYKIENKQLFLKFQKDSIPNMSTAKFLNSEKIENNEIDLKLKIVDQQKQPSPNARVILNGNIDTNYYSDSAGIVNIQDIAISETPIDIQVEPRELLDSHKFKFIPNKNSEILVTLGSARPKIIADTIFVYEILNMNRKKILLRNLAGSYDVEFLRQ